MRHASTLTQKDTRKGCRISGVKKVSKSRWCISFAPLGIVFIPPPRIKHVPWVEGIVSTEKHDKRRTLFMSQKASQQKGPAFSEIRWCCVLVSFQGRIMTALCPAHKVQTSLSDKRKVPGSLEVLSHEMIFCIMSMSSQYIFKRFKIFIISIFI